MVVRNKALTLFFLLSREFIKSKQSISSFGEKEFVPKATNSIKFANTNKEKQLLLLQNWATLTIKAGDTSA